MSLFSSLAKLILINAAVQTAVIVTSRIGFPANSSRSQLRELENNLKKITNMRDGLLKQLTRIGSIKKKIFNQLTTFANQINRIQNLPDKVDFSTREPIALIPYILFEDYLVLPNNLGNENNLLLYLAINGNLTDKNVLLDPQDGIALCVNEINCLNEELRVTFAPDDLINKTNNLINFYSLLINIAEPLYDKLFRYSNEYERYIRKMESVLVSKNDYRSIARYFNNMYLISLRLLDLVNTELIINDKANQKGVLYELNKRVF